MRLFLLFGASGAFIMLYRPGPVRDLEAYQFAGFATVLQMALWGPLLVAMHFSLRDILDGLRPPALRGLALRYAKVAILPMVALLLTIALMPTRFLPATMVSDMRLRTIIITVIGLVTIAPGWLGLLAGSSVASQQARAALATSDTRLIPPSQLVEQHVLLRSAVGRIRLALGIGFSGVVLALGLVWNSDSDIRSTLLSEVILNEDTELSAQLTMLDADLEIALWSGEGPESQGVLRAEHRRQTGAAIAASDQATAEAEEALDERSSASLYGLAILLVGLLIYMYWPTHAAMNMAGRRILDRLRPLGDPQDQARFDQVVMSRDVLKATLGLDTDGRASLERAAFALSPLMAAFFTQVFG